jgi:hypothetical protein
MIFSSLYDLQLFVTQQQFLGPFYCKDRLLH